MLDIIRGTMLFMLLSYFAKHRSILRTMAYTLGESENRCERPATLYALSKLTSIEMCILLQVDHAKPEGSTRSLRKFGGSVPAARSS